MSGRLQSAMVMPCRAAHKRRLGKASTTCLRVFAPHARLFLSTAREQPGAACRALFTFQTFRLSRICTIRPAHRTYAGGSHFTAGATREAGQGQDGIQQQRLPQPTSFTVSKAWSFSRSRSNAARLMVTVPSGFSLPATSRLPRNEPASLHGNVLYKVMSLTSWAVWVRLAHRLALDAQRVRQPPGRQVCDACSEVNAAACTGGLPALHSSRREGKSAASAHCLSALPLCTLLDT